MNRAVEETERRRHLQGEFNRAHGITPETIRKEIRDILSSVYEADYVTVPVVAEEKAVYRSADELERHIAGLEKEMREAAARLEFEEAARMRDEIKGLRQELLEMY
jgi:excinuclease ABC subunit B